MTTRTTPIQVTPFVWPVSAAQDSQVTVEAALAHELVEAVSIEAYRSSPAVAQWIHPHGAFRVLPRRGSFARPVRSDRARGRAANPASRTAPWLVYPPPLRLIAPDRKDSVKLVADGVWHREIGPWPGATLAALGEVSERPKERDWKSRTCRKVGRGFESLPLRFPERRRASPDASRR